MSVDPNNRPVGHGRALKALMAGGMIVGMALLFLVPPEDLPFTTCGFHALTGYSCPTCGMTRSLHAIAHGEITASFQYHLMGPLVFLLMLLLVAWLAFESVSGKRLNLHAGSRERKRVFMWAAIVWLVYWGGRLMTEFMA